MCGRWRSPGSGHSTLRHRTASKRCVAVSSTDTAPALIALGATVKLVSAEGERELPLEALYKNDGIDIFDFMGPCAPFKLDWADSTVEVNDWAVPLTIKGSLWTHVYLGFARDRLKAIHMALPESLKRITTPMLSTLLMVA